MSSKKRPKFDVTVPPAGVFDVCRRHEVGNRAVYVVSLIAEGSGVLLSSGVAILNPVDTDNPALGRKIATGRALKDFWVKYTCLD